MFSNGSWELGMNYSDHCAKWSFLGDVLMTKLLLMTFYDFLIRHFKKNVKVMFFLKSEKNEKYVFSNTAGGRRYQSIGAGNIRLWKLDSQKEWRNTSWRLWDERTEKDSAGFVDRKVNKNEWDLNKVGIKRELLDTVKARKLAYYGHTMRKQGSCLEKEIIQGTMPDARRRGRPRRAWMDNIKTWRGLSVEESIRMTEDRDKWSKYVHGIV